MSNLTGKTILLVGLSPELEMSVSALLVAAEVLICHTATEALHAVQQLTTDLVLIDADLADFDGHDLCRCIRTSWASGPKLMLLVSDNSPDGRLSAYRAGADDCLLKPFSAEELVAKCTILTHLKSEEQLSGMKTQLLDMVAHELRTPLTGIMVAGETLALEIEDDVLHPWVDMINDCAHRLKLMVDKGLLLCQLRSGDYATSPENQDLSELVRRLVREKQAAAEAEGVEIDVSDCDVAEIYVDRSAAETLVRFLLESTLRHCRPTSTVQLEIETDEQEVRLRVHAQARQILPINPFTEFVPRTSHDELVGADFGLAIVRELIRELDGSVDLMQTRTDEVTITCSFPRARERRMSATRRPMMAPTKLSFPESVQGLGVDTSDTGCFVTLDAALPIELELGDLEARIRGRVVRVQMSGGLLGFGIHFDEIAPAAIASTNTEATAGD